MSCFENGIAVWLWNTSYLRNHQIIELEYYCCRTWKCIIVKDLTAVGDKWIWRSEERISSIM
jgi:hypothetical protein